MEKLDLALLTKDELLTLANNAANRFMDDEGKSPIYLEVQRKIFNIVGDEINRRRKDEEAQGHIDAVCALVEYENMDDPRQKGIEGHVWDEGARLNGDYR